MLICYVLKKPLLCNYCCINEYCLSVGIDIQCPALRYIIFHALKSLLQSFPFVWLDTSSLN